MPVYNVHLYATTRVKLEGIEAETHEAAAEIAQGKFDESMIRDSEYADELTAALVDVQGDSEFEQSRTIEFLPGPGAVKLLTEAIELLSPLADDEPYQLSDFLEVVAAWRGRAIELVGDPATAEPTLRKYTVSLAEEPGDKFTIVFECQAEDADHAAEQAENAYPGCEVKHIGEATTAATFPGQDERACNEGWGLFERSDTGLLEIQADAESDIYVRGGFHYDDEAEAYVKAQAEAGSEYHKAALALVGTRADLIAAAD